MRRERFARCLGEISVCRFWSVTIVLDAHRQGSTGIGTGASQYGPQLHYLQVFYYPQDVPRELGPTELLPGSHFLYNLGQLQQNYMGHYGGIRGTYHTAAPAGSIFLTVYSIWHRRSASTGTGVRHNIKYSYFRTVEPGRDWLMEDNFDFATADYGFGKPLTYRQQHRDTIDNAEMFYWLSGKSEEFSWFLDVFSGTLRRGC